MLYTVHILILTTPEKCENFHKIIPMSSRRKAKNPSPCKLGIWVLANLLVDILVYTALGVLCRKFSSASQAWLQRACLLSASHVAELQNVMYLGTRCLGFYSAPPPPIQICAFWNSEVWTSVHWVHIWELEPEFVKFSSFQKYFIKSTYNILNSLKMISWFWRVTKSINSILNVKYMMEGIFVGPNHQECRINLYNHIINLNMRETKLSVVGNTQKNPVTKKYISCKIRLKLKLKQIVVISKVYIHHTF